MNNRKLIPGENHHWWPESLSINWVNNESLINVIKPDGRTFRSPPKKLGRIGGGHNVILNESSNLNHTYESEFDVVDSDFKKVIKVLTEIVKSHHQNNNCESNYCEHTYDNVFLNKLCNCLISLLVRAPMSRNQIVGFIDEIGTPMSKKDLKLLSAVNISGKLDRVSKRLKDKGKFIILFSINCEFIYGDGFYHNISMNVLNSAIDDRILVPLTPHLAIMYVNPTQCMKEPRLMTLFANRELVMNVNNMVQLYSKEYLFYKSERPILKREFLQNEHFEVEFSEYIEKLFNGIPGCFVNQ